MFSSSCSSTQLHSLMKVASGIYSSSVLLNAALNEWTLTYLYYSDLYYSDLLTYTTPDSLILLVKWPFRSQPSRSTVADLSFKLTLTGSTSLTLLISSSSVLRTEWLWADGSGEPKELEVHSLHSLILGRELHVALARSTFSRHWKKKTSSDVISPSSYLFFAREKEKDREGRARATCRPTG